MSPPPGLRDLNYIFFYKEPKVPGSGFGTGLANLVAALKTDFDWLREHTRYLQRATEWDRGGRPANRLLSGDDIAEAKAWAARRPKNAPEPTALHLDFIRASEEEAEARSSAQRRQLQERETALRQLEEAQRNRATMARIRNIALVAVTILAVLAGLLYLRSEQQRKLAEEQREQVDQLLVRAENIIWTTIAHMDIATLKKVFDIATLKEVFAVYQTGADRGDANSMQNLGTLYARGYGMAQDYAKAREWSEKAAEKGHWGGMLNLGLWYYDGRGVAKDYAKAREWFQKAADRSNDEVAMLYLGHLYHNGGWGVAQDYAKAREWYEKAADKGNAAMSNLGVPYANGDGVAQDYAKAREWSEKAAEKGNADAMSDLGVLYANGYGVAQDYAKAREWYEKAAAKGVADAMTNLGVLYESGQGGAQDYAKAREWYEKAADKGDAEARAQLEKLPIGEAAGAGRYAEALQLQEALAAKTEAAEKKREGKSGEETAQALNEVVWRALFARQFTKASTVAERAHALLPDDLTIEGNRAHALMFLGLGKKSKALYLAYKGKPLSEQDARLWERVIAEDFAEFRKAGLTHPMMAEIEKELGVSP